ncbi:efflux RND transporter periplasmic adaptor subunit [Rhizobiaceae bacterium BDR2-2]|uniref:Efflux RND transporter periplasmic adaptor subunit n=1 Tax=Ectorhizobium quercum TaxID=2965071 RepID=A0AAE3N3R0_9HYPH|nr:efflux RND transporter periplasmic adaptor subunit [Ectorhizobium quercum]MCX9000039.1 efflux RND transporter periplasmic adaptor subunit [Ectorhizobium quercum]
MLDRFPSFGFDALRRGGLVCALAAVLAACGQEKQAEEKPLTPVVVEKAAFTTYSPAVTMTGEIEARVETDLSFRVSGRIVERFAETGQHVRAGDLLARLDPEEQKADLAAAEASLRLAEAQQAQSSAAFNRSTELLQKGLTTRGDHDSARAALISARNAVDSARSAADSAREALGYTELRADADGIVTDRSAEVGQVAQAAQMMFRLARDGARDAVFHVQESIFLHRDAFEADKIEVAVQLINLPEVTATGVIREISPTIDAATGTVRVKAGLSDASAELALGAAVTGRVMLRPVQVIRVPWTAIGSLDGKPAVWILDRETGSVSMQDVTVFAYEKETMLVTDGLAPGAEIVSEGAKFLRTGQKVRIVGEAES